MASDKKAILLRLPADLCDALSRWARDELRSVNGQIEFALREAIRRRKGRGASGSSPTDDADESVPPS